MIGSRQPIIESQKCHVTRCIETFSTEGTVFSFFDSRKHFGQKKMLVYRFAGKASFLDQDGTCVLLELRLAKKMRDAKIKPLVFTFQALGLVPHFHWLRM
jgi:hypothetical protein